MAESSVAVTPGVGKNLHTNSRTISAVLYEDEYVLPGEYGYPTYTAVASAISLATANDHIMQLMAGTTLNLRIRSIKVTPSAATAVTTARIDILRLTTAGTGGTAVTPRPRDTADTAGATAMTLPTVKGTEGVTLEAEANLIGTATLPFGRPWLFVPSPAAKPIIVPAGTANGIALKSMVATAGCTVSIVIEFIETSFV